MLARRDNTGNAGGGAQHHGLSGEQLAELRSLLDALEALHVAMRATNAEHRRAITLADAGMLDACAREQAGHAGRLLELDARRAALVRSVTTGVGLARAAQIGIMAPRPASGAEGGPVTLRSLALRCAEPVRGELLAKVDRVRAVATTAAGEQAVLRRANEALLAHMHSLVAQVARALSHSGTYARPGARPSAAVVSGIDLTS